MMISFEIFMMMIVMDGSLGMGLIHLALFEMRCWLSIAWVSF